MGKTFNWNKWTRKTHYWGAFIILLPVLIVSITGIFLQLKKEIDWIQPPTVRGDLPNNPSISFEEILEAAKTVKETNIESWNDIECQSISSPMFTTVSGLYIFLIAAKKSSVSMW